MEKVATFESHPGLGTGGFLEPDVVVKEFGLKPGDHVADFGAGHGYFTIPIARIVGGDGRVYAFDIQKSVLEVIRSKAQLEHLLNIETVWADLDKPAGSRLKDSFLDLVLAANILFQVDDKSVIFKEAARVLQRSGKLVVIEWVYGAKISFGPPQHLLIREDEVKRFAQEAGLTFIRQFDAGKYHYGLIFRKS